MKVKASQAICRLALLLILIWPASARADEIYNINRASVSQPGATLTRIRITPSQTIITVRYVNKDGQGRVRVFPPGTKWTFFIVDKDTSRKYHLTGSQGAPVHPDSRMMRPGDSLTLTLYFPKIPPIRFDLLEGSSPLKDHTSWHFTDIDLSKLKAIGGESAPKKAPEKKEPQEEMKRIGQAPPKNK